MNAPASLTLDPDLRILGASPEYLRATLLGFSDIAGEHMFDVFPDNPDDPDADGVASLDRSLRAVLKTRAPQPMPLQRYDVRDRIGDADWVEKHWRVENVPVFGSGSREVVRIEHQVRDVTLLVRARASLRQREAVIHEQLTTLLRMERDLIVQGNVARTQRQRVDAALKGDDDRLLLAELRDAAQDDRAYFGAGECVPVTSPYEAIHRTTCARRRVRVLLSEGGACPRCATCDAVMYRLVRPAT